MQDEHEAHVKPRLPADPAYWTGLTSRIVAGAEPMLEELRTREPWWKPLARFGPPLGVAAATAALAVIWLFPGGAEPSTASQLEIALGPSDPVARAFVLSPAPPDISTLFSLHQEEAR